LSVIRHHLQISRDSGSGLLLSRNQKHYVTGSVVKTNNHYHPTDSSLLEDGVRVITRTLHKM
jgi:hypothetical protein